MPSTSTSTKPVPANLRRRLLAMLYDSILVFALMFCAAMLYAAIVIAISPEANTAVSDVETGQVVHEIPLVELGIGIWLYLAAVAVTFYIFFWKKSGQTLGMRAWKITLRSSTGNQLRISQLLIRIVLAILSFSLLGVGYWYVFFNSEQATLHDKLSKTRVEMPSS